MLNYCIYCGAALPPDVQLCPRCGRLVPVVEEAPAAVETRSAQAPAQPQEPFVAPQAEAAEAAAPPEAPADLPSQAPKEEPLPSPKAQAAPLLRQAPSRLPPKYVPVGMPAGTGQMGGLLPMDLLTTGGVLGMVLLGLLPFVGWIVLLVWAFDSASGPNHRALAKGLLLAKVIIWALLLLLVGFLMFLPWLLSLYYGY